jgi:hypothetical protein
MGFITVRERQREKTFACQAAKEARSVIGQESAEAAPRGSVNLVEAALLSEKSCGDQDQCPTSDDLGGDTA